VSALPFLYVGGHFPFCLRRVPYFRTNNSNLEPYGEGTIYPLTMTPAQFAACFWRVKSWRFSGNIAFNFTVVGSGINYVGESDFDLTFPRDTDESRLICQANTVPNSPFTTINQSDMYIDGTKTQSGVTTDAVFRFTVRMSTRTVGLSTLRMAALDENEMLQCYFGATLFAAVHPSGGTVAVAQSEEYEDSAPGGSISLVLPGQEPISLTMFGTSPVLTDVTIEPAEYFEWGGIYDSETGDLL
jgi:hypothetical protein